MHFELVTFGMILGKFTCLSWWEQIVTLPILGKYFTCKDTYNNTKQDSKIVLIKAEGEIKYRYSGSGIGKLNQV